MKSLFSLFLVILICFNQIFGQETENIVSKIHNGIISNELVNNSEIKASRAKSLLNINSSPFLTLESFEDTENFPPLNWINYTDGFDQWEQGYDYIDGEYSAYSNAYSESENWLITPQIDLTEASNAILTYYDEFDDTYAETDQDQFLVLISIDYSGSGDPTLATWTQIHSGITEYYDWNLQEIDLTDYLGQTVYIAFQYIPYFDGTDYISGTDWYIDAVRVSDDGCTGIEPVPNSATVDSPPNGATLIPVDVPLSWIPPSADITKQFLYLGTDGGGTTTPTNKYNGLEFGNYTSGFTATNLNPNTTYYWQIIPANCAYQAANCPIWSFTTGDGNLNYGGGGPTQGDYYYENSISGTAHQPTYNWIDISSTGTDLITSINDDQTKGSFQLGFDFDFFGNTYSTFYINADGFVSFGYPNGQVSYGFTMPSTYGPENIIAGFWMSLNPTNTSVTGQHLYYGTDNGDMVITFEKYPQYFSYNNPGDADAWITFQIIIRQNGNIKIQYKEKGSSFIVSGLNAGKVGIENSDGTKGVLYKYSDTGGPVFDGSSPLAVEFYKSSLVTANVELKIFLEGPYSSGNMNTSLGSNIPTGQPFTTSPWNYTGNETTTSTFVSTNSIVDWVYVELRSGSSPGNAATVVAKRAALVRNDGVVLDTDGSTDIDFGDVDPGDYYLAVYHRNHLSIISSQVITIGD